MSGATESLARKIGSATDLEGVVRSMKALAASSIGQYERAVHSLDDYFRTVELGLSQCLRAQGVHARARSSSSTPKAVVGLVLFGSDQGLVGRFNEAMVQSAKRIDGVTQDSRIWVVGERARALLVDTGYSDVRTFAAPNAITSVAGLVSELLDQIEPAFAKAEVSAVLAVHNHPTGGAGYEDMVHHLLPLDCGWYDRLAKLAWPTRSPPEVLGQTDVTLRAFIHEYLFVQLFQACVESLASENASRLAAMERAERSISDLLDGLNRTFHRLRQEAIDEELFDVISGFEALSSRAIT